MVIHYGAIGKRTIVVRIRKAISQEEFAELRSISSKHMSNIEASRTKSSLLTLIVIVNVLDTSADFFLCNNIIKPGYVFKEESNNLKNKLLFLKESLFLSEEPSLNSFFINLLGNNTNDCLICYT